jgi:hypothetical protein
LGGRPATPRRGLAVEDRERTQGRESKQHDQVAVLSSGVILTGAQCDFCRTWPDQVEITVPGLHFIQADSGRQIGEAIAAWLDGLA